jgi:hypothetical protein
MATLTTQQVAELLIGIARAQQAVIEAIESQKAGFRAKHLAGPLNTAARVRNTTHAPTLMDFPSRVLLAHQGRNPPDVAQIARELEALLAPAPAAAAPAAGAGGSLDMTQS